MYYFNPNKIQAIIGEYNPYTATSKHIGMNEEDYGQYDNWKTNINNYIVGASMFLSKGFIQEVGLMADDYFLYYEEIDWVNRGRNKGYEFSICKNSIVYHKEGASIGSNNTAVNNKSLISDLYSIRNRFIITKKYYKKFLLPVYLSIVPIVINRIKRRQFERVIPIIKIFVKSLIKK